MLSWFKFDALSLLMLSLIGFISIIVLSFSSRYLEGDRKQSHFVIHTIALTLSVMVFVSANFLPLFLCAWASSHLFLTRLMLHKTEWRAAQASVDMAWLNFAIGFCCLSLGTGLLALHSHSLFLSAFDYSKLDSKLALLSGISIIIAAMTQSAIWPFHRWLLSSLNSPTPVSALMHAGVVNGGGFLLATFSGLFFAHSILLHIIFVLGALTALLATTWKLMQHDVKRMLACSTMAQMGFMIAECGLGLFAAAVSHLIWHGMFKAYLFLNSGSAASEKRVHPASPPSIWLLGFSLLIGLLGASCFVLSSGSAWLPNNTQLIIHILALLACTQGALSVCQSRVGSRYLLAVLASVVIGSIYGFNLNLIESVLQPLHIHQAQVLTPMHQIIIALMVMAWFGMLLRKTVSTTSTVPAWKLRLYVSLLNASQADAKTITAHRNHYHF